MRIVHACVPGTCLTVSYERGTLVGEGAFRTPSLGAAACELLEVYICEHFKFINLVSIKITARLLRHYL